MLFLALAVPALYAYAASLRDIARPGWFADISLAISTSLAGAPDAEVPSVDPIAAAKVDEDLDYRIAERTKSMEGWRGFLAAHPNGVHAQSARAELDALSMPAAPSEPIVAQPPGVRTADTNNTDGGASPASPALDSNAATLTSDEMCGGDQERLQQLSASPTSDGVLRLLIELRCEKLRPQLLLLAKRLDTAPAVPADTPRETSSNPPPAQDAPKSASAEERKPRTESRHRAHAAVASHRAEPRRRSNRDKAASVPPFLLAIFGERAKTPPPRPTRSAGGSQ